MKDAIESLVRSGGDDNRLVLQGRGGYLVVCGVKGAASVTTYAASGRLLTGDRKLSTDAQQQLYDAGFRRRVQADPFGRSSPLTADTDAERLAAELATLAERLYGEQRSTRVLLGDAPQIENPTVLGAMTHLSKARSMPARFGLYSTLVRAELLLMVESGGPKWQPGAPLRPVTVEQLSERPVFVVFTDWATAKRYDARGPRCTQVGGAALFPALKALRPALLRINPRGQIGGELYGHEVDTISDKITGR